MEEEGQVLEEEGGPEISEDGPLSDINVVEDQQGNCELKL